MRTAPKAGGNAEAEADAEAKKAGKNNKTICKTRHDICGNSCQGDLFSLFWGVWEPLG